MYHRTVLIVEDEPLIRMTLADALEDESYGVLEAGTVLEAIAILGHHHVDAVITDIDMPGALSGIDLADFLHLSMRSLPLIVTSGRRDGAKSSLPKGTPFIAKPYALTCIIELLVSLLDAGETARRSENRVRMA